MTVAAARMATVMAVVVSALVVLNECMCIGSCIDGNNDSDGWLMALLGAERVAVVALVKVAVSMMVHCDNIGIRIYCNGGDGGVKQ